MGLSGEQAAVIVGFLEFGGGEGVERGDDILDGHSFGGKVQQLGQKLVGRGLSGQGVIPVKGRSL